MSDSTEFVIDVQVPGQPSLDAAARSVDGLVASQGAASKAVVATSDAIKAGEVSYRKAEQAADAAAKAVERIGIAANAQRGKLQIATETGNDKGSAKAAAALRVLTDRQTEASAKAQAAKIALNAEAVALDKLRAGSEHAGKAEAEHEIKLAGTARALKKIGGPLGEGGAKAAELGHAWERLSGSFGSGGAAAIVGVVGVTALAAAVLALSAAVVAGVVKIAAWSVGLADANRSASFLVQGIARSVAGGQQLDDKISDLTKLLPLTREELSSTAQGLANAGLRGNALTTALERSAIAAAKLKFGPDFEEQMLSLDEQSKVFHANLAEIFGGLKVEGLLRGLQKLGNLFDESSESGKAIKVVFESLFQPLVDGMTGAVPKIERFFIQFEILVIRALTAIKPWGSILLHIGEVFVIGSAIIVGVFVAAVGLAVAAVAAFVYGLGATIVSIIDVGEAIFGGFRAAFAWIQGLDLAAMGKALIDGLVQGIAAGAGAVLSAMKGVVNGAIDGAKKALGIASPSKVFAEIGMQTGAGMEVGVDRSASGVQDAVSSMVEPPSSGGKAPAASAPAASGKSIGNVTIQLYGVKGAEDAIAQMTEALTRLLEGDAAQLGATAPG